MTTLDLKQKLGTGHAEHGKEIVMKHGKKAMNKKMMKKKIMKKKKKKPMGKKY